MSSIAVVWYSTNCRSSFGGLRQALPAFQSACLAFERNPAALPVGSAAEIERYTAPTRFEPAENHGGRRGVPARSAGRPGPM